MVTFDDALRAFDAGDAERLRSLLAADPRLVHARTRLEPPHDYFSGATLLHHVAGNPARERPLPQNVVALARILLEAGSDASARTVGPNGGDTLGLVLTSKQASDRDVSGSLIDLLLAHGARLDLAGDDVLDASLANHAPRAAERLIALGARPDLFAAAALGDMDALRGFFDASGTLNRRPRRRGSELSARDAVGLALLYAYVNGRGATVDFLLERDGNWNMTGVNNGTALHRAASEGDLAMVARLVARGADVMNRDNPFDGTPLDWALHAGQTAVADWLRGRYGPKD